MPLYPPNPSWTTVMKGGDTTRTNNTILADPDLQFTVSPLKAYALRIRLFYQTSATPDFKFQITYPNAGGFAALKLSRNTIVPAATAYSNIGMITAGTSLALLATSGANGCVALDGVLYTDFSGSPGTFSIDWAQNTTDASGTILFAGSYIEWIELPLA